MPPAGAAAAAAGAPAPAPAPAPAGSPLAAVLECVGAHGEGLVEELRGLFAEALEEATGTPASEQDELLFLPVEAAVEECVTATVAACEEVAGGWGAPLPAALTPEKRDQLERRAEAGEREASELRARNDAREAELAAARTELEGARAEFRGAMDRLLQALPADLVGSPAASGGWAGTAGEDVETVGAAIEALVAQAKLASDRGGELERVREQAERSQRQLRESQAESEKESAELRRRAETLTQELVAERERAKAAERGLEEATWEHDAEKVAGERAVEGLQGEVAALRSRIEGEARRRERAEDELHGQQRQNRILALENSFAVDQLRSHAHLSGVSVAKRPASATSPRKLPRTPTRNAAPLDPTSRRAHVKASPARKDLAAETNQLAAEAPHRTYLHQSPRFRLAKDLYLDSLMGQSMETSGMVLRLQEKGLSLDSSSPEAVDVMVDDFLARFQAAGISLSCVREGPCEYRLAGTLYKVKNMSGKLVVRKGGGYRDLIDLIEKLVI